MEQFKLILFCFALILMCIALSGCTYDPTKDAMGVCLQEVGQREVSVSATGGKIRRVDCKVGARIDTGS